MGVTYNSWSQHYFSGCVCLLCLVSIPCMCRSWDLKISNVWVSNNCHIRIFSFLYQSTPRIPNFIITGDQWMRRICLYKNKVSESDIALFFWVRWIAASSSSIGFGYRRLSRTTWQSSIPNSFFFFFPLIF